MKSNSALFSALLGAVAAIGLSATAQAVTILPTQAGYSGDFTGITIALEADDVMDQTNFNSGWVTSVGITDTSAPIWVTESGVAVRQTTNQGAGGRGFAIAFDKDGVDFSSGTLSFDWTNESTTTGEILGYALYGISDSTNFSLTLDSGTSSGGFGTTSGLVLLTEGALPINDSGTLIAPLTNLNPASYDGYVFAAHGERNPTSIDNVELTVVPEPSAGALIMGGAGLFLLLRRGRRR